MKNTTLSLVLSVGMLAGCNSEDVFEVNLDEVNRRTGIQLINASALPLDYHIGSFKSNGDAPDVKGQKFRLGSLEAGQDPTWVKVTHNWTDDRISVQAFHRLTAQGSEYLQHKTDVGKDLALVAWQDGPQIRLSIFRNTSSSENGVYRLRILATAEDIKLQAGSVKLSLKKGELSPWLSLNHCLGELQHNQQPLDLCKATAGQSFLLVLDQTRLLSLTQS